jgi:hypothetical protein
MNASTVFPMIPAASKSLWFFAIIGLILVGVFLMMSWVAWSMQHAKFTVSNEGLRLQGDLYGRLIPLKSLKLDEAVVTNLNTDKDHQPNPLPKVNVVCLWQTGGGEREKRARRLIDALKRHSARRSHITPRSPPCRAGRSMTSSAATRRGRHGAVRRC